MISRKSLERFAAEFEGRRLTAIPAFLQELEKSRTLAFFDWSAWHGEAARLLADSPAMARLDRDTALKLLTYLVRADQNRPGSLSLAVSSGALPVLLRRLAMFCE